MTLVLPRPPDVDLFDKNPREWARQMRDFLTRFVTEIERDARDVATPAKAVFTLSNIPASTTTLDGGTAGVTEIINYLGGMTETLIAKGIIRSKAADP